MKAIDKEDIDKAVETLRNGGLILYPTDTVWGIGCDATNPEAVAKVFSIKKRNDAKALITLVPSDAWLERYVEDVPDIAWELLDVAVEPLTIVYDNGKNLAPNLLAADGSVGLRVTHERYSAELCRRLKKPVVSTSANISGEPTPGNYADISPEIKERVDYIAAYRREDFSEAKPSAVIKLSKGGVVKVLR